MTRAVGHHQLMEMSLLAGTQAVQVQVKAFHPLAFFQPVLDALDRFIHWFAPWFFGGVESNLGPAPRLF
jgi:hypothetical protein